MLSGLTSETAEPRVDPVPAASDGDGPSLPRGGLAERARAVLDRSLEFRVPTLAFVGTHVVVLGALVAAVWLEPSLRVHTVLAEGWDAGLFVSVAEHGYPAGSVGHGVAPTWAFFPALPLAIRGVVVVTTLPFAAAATIVATVFSFTASLAVWVAVKETFSEKLADRSTLLFMFFPTAYVLSMAYSEGMFMTCVGFCLYALRRRMWVTAGCCCLVGGLTRNLGAVLILTVWVAVALEIRRGGRPLRPLVAALLAPLGFVAWAIFSWVRSGTPVAFVRAELNWGGAHFVWFKAPFVSFARVLSSTTNWRLASTVIGTLTVVLIAVGAYQVVRSWRKGFRLPLPWLVYLVGAVLVACTSYWSSSTLRFMMMALPLFVIFAFRIREKWMPLTVAVFAGMQGIIATVVFAGLVHWQMAPLSP